MFGKNVKLFYVCEFSSEILPPDSFPYAKKRTWSVLNQGLKYTNEFIEHELAIFGRRIYWKRGVDALRRPPTMYFSLESEIHDALICRFPKYLNDEYLGTDFSCLCVVESSRITAFSEDEDIFNISLPFPLKGIWSSKFGLILQRQPTEYEKNIFQSKNLNIQRNDDQSSSTELPVLFTLTHPLNEPTHVLYNFGDSSGFINYFCNPLIDVVHVNENPSLVFLYDSFLMQHSIWLMTHPSKNSFHSHIDNLVHMEQPMSSSAPPRVQHFEITPFNSPLKLYTPSPINCNKHISSNPDCVSTPFLSGGTLRSVPLVEASTSKRIDSLRVATAKRNLSQVIYDFSSGCESKCKFNKILNSKQIMDVDKQRSRLGPGIASMKRAKSLSPNSISLPSPLSRSILPNIFNPKFSHDDQTEPVHPEICLLNVYSQPKDTKRIKADKVFLHEDIFNRNYVVFVDRMIGRIWLLELFFQELGAIIQFGKSLYIDALDAVSIDALHFLLCLKVEECSLHIYSSNVHICQVFLDSPQKPLNLRDSILDCVTIAFQDGSTKRYRIPTLSQNHTITLIISALTQILPQALFHDFLHCAYTNSNNILNSELSNFLNILNTFYGAKKNVTNHHPTIRNALQSIIAESRVSYLPTLRFLIHSKFANYDHHESIVPSSSLRDYVYQTFIYIHLILEEVIISPFLNKEVLILTKFLSNFVVLFNLPIDYLEYYQGLIPSTTDKMILPLIHSTPPKASRNKVNSLFFWLTDLLMFPSSDPSPFPYIPNVTTKTILILCMNIILLLQSNSNFQSNLEMYVKNISTFPQSIRFHSRLKEDFSSLYKHSTVQQMLVYFLYKRKINKPFLMNINSAYSIPIIDFLDSCRSDPPKDLPGTSYILLDRADIAFHQKCVPSSYITNINESKPPNPIFPEPRLLDLLFPVDNRVFEVSELLDSSQCITIDIEQSQNLSDEDFLELQSARLLKLSTRSLALPIGRGMFDYGSCIILDTDLIFIPELNISGKASSTNTTISIDTLDKPLNFTFWPEFHNGVAAGLTLDPLSRHIDSSWIQFNQPHISHRNEYAGFLMAMGLQGHLSSLSKFTMHEFLSRGHELTLVGILIGISAAKRASMDQDITRMLSIHVRSLQPESSMELEISPNVQTAAILSVGLLYQGTSNRHIVDVLLNEIERFSSCEMENIFDRRCRCLSAGFALGLTLLALAKERGIYPLKEITEKLTNNILGHFQNTFLDVSVRSQQISDEGIDIMSLGPGSLMALSMIYLKSGDKSISNFLKPDDSYFLLDETHPHILLLQTISYCLVQWNEIQPTQDWLDSIIPHILINNINKDRKDLIQDGMELDVIKILYSHILVGCLFSLGLRFAGSQNKLAYEFIYRYLHDFVQDRTISVSTSDTRINCSLLACSLVMCGTGDTNLLKMIYQLRSISKEDNDYLVGYGKQMIYHMALGFVCLGKFKYCLLTSNEAIAYLLISLYPIFPDCSSRDIYHLQAFRHLYALSLERRFLYVKEFFSNEPCVAHATLNYSLSDIIHTQEIRLPFLVPGTYKIISIIIHSENYWPIQIHGSINYFNNLFLEGGLIYLLKRGFFWEIYPIGVSRILMYDFYIYCLAAIVRNRFDPVFTKTYISQFDFTDNYLSLNLTGHKCVQIYDSLICIDSNFDIFATNLIGSTLSSQQLLFLHLFYHKRHCCSVNLYMQEILECIQRKFSITLQKISKELYLSSFKVFTIWSYQLKY